MVGELGFPVDCLLELEKKSGFPFQGRNFGGVCLSDRDASLWLCLGVRPLAVCTCVHGFLNRRIAPPSS